MARFNDLPLELLPQILAEVEVYPTQELCVLCLVHPTWTAHARALLYANVFLNAYDDRTSGKIVDFLKTLSVSPHLSPLVRSLDIYGWYQAKPLERDATAGALVYCTNLRSISWFAKYPLYSDVLRSLPKGTKLSQVEIDCCGEFGTQDEPDSLGRISDLKSLSMSTPSPHTISGLTGQLWHKTIGTSIQSLAFRADSGHTGPLVTDGFIQSIAPYLPQLESIVFSYCRGVSQKGPLAILAEKAKSGCLLKELTLRFVSPDFDIAIFASECTSAGYLRELTSLTLEVEHDEPNGDRPRDSWGRSVLKLVRDSPLRSIRFESCWGLYGPPSVNDICKALVERHGATLQSIELLDINISADLLFIMLSQCPGLVRFTGGVFDDFQSCTDILKDGLSHASKLESINLDWPLSESEIIDLVQLGPPALTSIGARRKTWRVIRQFDRNSNIVGTKLVALE